MIGRSIIVVRLLEMPVAHKVPRKRSCHRTTAHFFTVDHSKRAEKCSALVRLFSVLRADFKRISLGLVDGFVFPFLRTEHVLPLFREKALPTGKWKTRKLLLILACNYIYHWVVEMKHTRIRIEVPDEAKPLKRMWSKFESCHKNL